MNSMPSPSNPSRYEGCTLTGALAVVTQVRDAACIIHGPAGCTHHNFSLLHATLLGNDTAAIPRLISTRLGENEIIFGGEDALERCIARVHEAPPAPAAIFVLSTCIVETIGDDTAAVCARGWETPVIPIRTSGFLGGVFQTGFVGALLAAGTLAEQGSGQREGVTLIGEKNLEYDVDENYAEVVRLLAYLDLAVNLRFVRDTDTAALSRLGTGAFNILREPALREVGEALHRRHGTPFIDSFPVGLAGTLRFLREAGKLTGRDTRDAVREEEAYQEEMLAAFADLAGARVRFDRLSPLLEEDAAAGEVVAELAAALDLRVAQDGIPLPPPYPAPVGTAGVRRLLHRWRRAIRTNGRRSF
ncbi:oxidoreductase [Methanoculleus sp. FWC-SCC1]|uniref:Oxidoreductase n=1 Tax=Methanoculleus frigidifontis TaxID=2584085 RepID=A0ABT8MC65_9EURY|nr:nitrogenase component 1 [Methanoculleus sp. FWC-SCC1]MDN7025537.1 oxidoreductase [Methanoculleus sp. FWC-SCC1]